jgi:DNA-binding MarR family transcriptional regulator
MKATDNLIEGADLTGLVGYQLQRLNLQFAAATQSLLRNYDISPARFSALLLIRDNPGCTQSALGKALDVNRASSMKIVNYLQDRGLVTRAASADMRANALFITPRARTLLPEILAALKAFDRSLMTGISSAEQDQFLTTLAKLRQSGGEAPAADEEND